LKGLLNSATIETMADVTLEIEELEKKLRHLADCL
jgi:hypothetical protein